MTVQQIKVRKSAHSAQVYLILIQENNGVSVKFLNRLFKNVKLLGYKENDDDDEYIHV